MASNKKYYFTFNTRKICDGNKGYRIGVNLYNHPSHRNKKKKMKGRAKSDDRKFLNDEIPSFYDDRSEAFLFE